MRWTSCTVTLLVLLSSVQDKGLSAKRLLLFPAPNVSHVRYYTKVGRVLHSMGHQVWIPVPDHLMKKGVLDTTNLTVIPYTLNDNMEELMQKRIQDSFSGIPFNIQEALSKAIDVCDEILKNEELEKRIRAVQADLMVLDNLPPVYTLMVLPYKLQVPFAMMGTIYDVHVARIPYSSAVNPFQLGSSSDEMTFLERVKSMLLHEVLHLHSPFMLRDVVSIYAPEMPYIPNHELLARPEIWLVEMDHILDYPRPTLPNVKLIGGTVTDQAKPLPAELQTFMDSGSQGVAIVTFGSFVLGVPKHISDKLFNVFQKLPFKVVFRSNLTSPDPANVWVSRWLPQNDLLGHPNTKVFVSHCGKNGQYEALFHAVPLVCMPLFAEQPYNSERIRKKGFGEVVDIHKVSPEEMLSLIISVGQEPRYKRAISKASLLFRQQYGVPMQEAARWLDHVMEYGGDYMRYAGQKIPLYQFLGLDVFAFLFALGALSCGLIFCCVRMTCRVLRRKKKTD